MTTAFALALCQALGVPAAASTLLGLNLWAASEGMADSAYNPLACTRVYGASRPLNSAGVQAYASFEDGVAATAAMIRQANMVHILRALAATAPLDSLWHVVNASPWCAHCQDGLYPVALFTYVRHFGGGPFTDAAEATGVPAGAGGAPVGIAEPAPQPAESSDDWAPHIRRTRDWVAEVRPDIVAAGDGMIRQFGNVA